MKCLFHCNSIDELGNEIKKTIEVLIKQLNKQLKLIRNGDNTSILVKTGMDGTNRGLEDFWYYEGKVMAYLWMLQELARIEKNEDWEEAFYVLSKKLKTLNES